MFQLSYAKESNDMEKDLHWVKQQSSYQSRKPGNEQSSMTEKQIRKSKKRQ